MSKTALLYEIVYFNLLLKGVKISFENSMIKEKVCNILTHLFAISIPMIYTWNGYLLTTSLAIWQKIKLQNGKYNISLFKYTILSTFDKVVS